MQSGIKYPVVVRFDTQNYAVGGGVGVVHGRAATAGGPAVGNKPHVQASAITYLGVKQPHASNTGMP